MARLLERMEANCVVCCQDNKAGEVLRSEERGGPARHRSGGGPDTVTRQQVGALSVLSVMPMAGWRDCCTTALGPIAYCIILIHCQLNYIDS